jgi:hypothetical protein
MLPFKRACEKRGKRERAESKSQQQGQEDRGEPLGSRLTPDGGAHQELRTQAPSSGNFDRLVPRDVFPLPSCLPRHCAARSGWEDGLQQVCATKSASSLQC